jgi:arabinose-5-phosphate isomerase
MDYHIKARMIVNLEADALKDVSISLGRAFDSAINLLLECVEKKGKIIVTGVGKCLHVAGKIAATLVSTGVPGIVLNPSQAMHGDLGLLTASDVLIALSYSGESDELLSLIPLVRRLGSKIIAITGDRTSKLADYSDVVIWIKIKREACPFNMIPTSSTTAMMAVGDAIAIVLLEARGFKKEDYAKLHPGGTIGRTLLLRVSDIMRTGAKLAVVPQNAKVIDAVVAMTRARAGSAAVVDGRRKVVGIFTDGDLRRHLSSSPNLLQIPIKKVMTPKPVTVESSKLAVDVLSIFEKHNIDDILVVDKKGRLVGAIDIQDLPKFKIL